MPGGRNAWIKKGSPTRRARKRRDDPWLAKPQRKDIVKRDDLEEKSHETLFCTACLFDGVPDRFL